MYLAYSRVSPSGEGADVLAAATMLLDAGADPNARDHDGVSDGSG
jgi:hypothetical protein